MEASTLCLKGPPVLLTTQDAIARGSDIERISFYLALTVVCCTGGIRLWIGTLPFVPTC